MFYALYFAVVLACFNSNSVDCGNQAYYKLYQKPSDCLALSTSSVNYFFSITQLICSPCTQNASMQTVSPDGLSCICQPGYYLTYNFGATINCSQCPSGSTTSFDGWSCVQCTNSSTTDATCPTCAGTDDGRVITVQRELDGSYPDGAIQQCQQCQNKTAPNPAGKQCVRCNQILSMDPNSYNCYCPPNQQASGMCFRLDDMIPQSAQLYEVRFGSNSLSSAYFTEFVSGAIAICNPSKYGNQTACEQMGNMCVLTLYQRSTADNTGSTYVCDYYKKFAITEWPANMPWLYYTTATATEILSDNGIATQFAMNQPINFRLNAYSINGSFLGYRNVTSGLLQLCKNTENFLNAAYMFGVTYSQSCQLTVEDFWDETKYPAVFYDMWLEYVVDGEKRLFAIPVLIEDYTNHAGTSVNTEKSRTNWVLVRRFFLVDNLSGKSTNLNSRALYVRYAKSITINIELQADAGTTDGLIYPPYVQINYEHVADSDTLNTLATLTFDVKYMMSYTSIETGIAIAVGVLSGVAVIYAFLCTWSWFRRSGRTAIDISTIFKFLLFALGSVGDAIFVVTLGAAIWWMFFYKLQSTVTVAASTTNSLYVMLLAIAFSFKFFGILHIFIVQSTVDIFLIDWEKPENKPLRSESPGHGDGKPGKTADPVSIWRTYFVANEWNEIQTKRKLNPIFQIACSVFFLSVIGFGNWGTTDPYQYYQLNDPNHYYSPMSVMFRFAMIGIVYLLTALVQWLFFVIFYERFIEHPIRQFVDLCSMCNISMLLLESTVSGYYIHGRSPHGKADTGLRHMHVNMIREKLNLCSQRGLETGCELQTFRVVLPRRLRTQYDRILMPVLVMTHGGAAAARTRALDGAIEGTSVKLEPYLEASIEAYGVLNQLFQSFIQHSWKSADYVVRDRKLLEQLLDIEFEDARELGFFYRDPSQSFDWLLFYGHELSLLVFEILFFGLMDLAIQNYLFGGAMVYLLMDIIIRQIRDAVGRLNLAKKTLVDKRFLI